MVIIRMGTIKKKSDQLREKQMEMMPKRLILNTHPQKCGLSSLCPKKEIYYDTPRSHWPEGPYI